MWSWLKKKKDKVYFDYSSFVKLDVYLAHHCGMGTEIIERNDVVWTKWNDYYIARDTKYMKNMIRKGDLRESSTIYIYDIFAGTGVWLKQPDDDLAKLIEEAIDYWDLHIG